MRIYISSLTILIAFFFIPAGLSSQDKPSDLTTLAITQVLITGLAFPASKILEPNKNAKTLVAKKSPFEQRRWTDISGKHATHATYLSFKDGKVHLKKADGTEVEISIGELSKKDQAFVRELRRTTIFDQKKRSTKHNSTRRRSSRNTVSRRIKRKVGNDIGNKIKSSLRRSFGR